MRGGFPGSEVFSSMYNQDRADSRLVGLVIGFVDKIIDEIQVLEKIHVYRLVFDNGF